MMRWVGIHVGARLPESVIAAEEWHEIAPDDDGVPIPTGHCR